MFKRLFKTLITDHLQGSTLKARFTRSSLWLGLGNGSEKLLRLLRNMLLTRILLPQIFGVVAIVLSINMFFESFTEIGINKAIIQHPQGSRQTYLNNAFWISVARSIGLYILCFFVAPYIAKFYGNANLILLMRVAFLVIVFHGAMSPRVYAEMKKIAFGKWTLIHNGGGIFGILFTLILVLILKSEIALIIGFTSESFVRTILSYVVCPFKPGFKIDRVFIKDLLRFARGVIGLPILTFTFMNADIFVAGKLLPTRELGLYSMALTLARMPFMFLASIVQKILFSALSEIQDEDKKFYELILRSTDFFFLFGLPSLLFVVLLKQEILTVIYGEKYAEVAIPFAIIFGSELLRTCSIPMSVGYFAKGSPEVHRRFVVLRAVLMILFIYPAVKTAGLIGAALSSLITMTLSFFFQAWNFHKYFNLPIKRYVGVILKSFSGNVWFAIFGFFTYFFFINMPVVRVILSLICCFFAYVFFIIVIKKRNKSL